MGNKQIHERDEVKDEGGIGKREIGVFHRSAGKTEPDDCAGDDADGEQGNIGGAEARVQFCERSGQVAVHTNRIWQACCSGEPGAQSP